MITDFSWPEIDQIGTPDLWFQQDGAEAHTALQTTNLLNVKFLDRVIKKYSDVNRPPRSCNLTLKYYFLWGF